MQNLFSVDALGYKNNKKNGVWSYQIDHLFWHRYELRVKSRGPRGWSMFRAVGRYENPKGPVLMLGQNLLSLVGIGSIDLPKIGGTSALAPTVLPPLSE